MKRKMMNHFTWLFAALMVFVLPLSDALAHGGEDHGDQKVATAPAGANMVARVVRVGDFEVTVKHPNIESDKETQARVFVTRFATNEPVGNAQIVLVVEGPAGPTEVAATPGSAPGIYDVKLPPLPQGEAKLSARVTISGESMTASYGVLQVKRPETASVLSVALWARTTLVVLGALTALALVACAIYFALPYVRRSRIKEEAATA